MIVDGMRAQVCRQVLEKTCHTVTKNGHHEKLCYNHHVTKCVGWCLRTRLCNSASIMHSYVRRVEDEPARKGIRRADRSNTQGSESVSRVAICP